MERRRFLAAAALGASLLAGCGGRSGGSGAPAATSAGSSAGTPGGPTTDGEDLPVDPDASVVVSSSGVDGAAGTVENPLGSVQEAVRRAVPGQTVYVRAGRYEESVRTVRSGVEGAPITITGPPDAVLTGEPREGYSGGLQIGHSHIHLTGLTIDGLQDPDASGEASSYVNIAVNCLPRTGEYLTDLVVAPHGIGNTRGSMVDLNFVEGVEVGPFRVVGPSGVDYLLGEKVGHFGEIVYLGSPPGATFNAIERTGELAGEIDASNDVHVHHVDNSAGHGHVELFDVKAGTHDVTVEYCTSVGARLPSDNDHSSAVHIGGRDVTFRWNRIVDPASRAIDVGNYAESLDRFPHPELPDAATGNAIYGNELLGAGSTAINFTSETSEDRQRVVCGNVVDGESEGDPTRACPEGVPTGDGVGHTGGGVG